MARSRKLRVKKNELEKKLASGEKVAVAARLGISGGALSKILRELAVVHDGECYSASFNVLPSFGCVLHEEKTS